MVCFGGATQRLFFNLFRLGTNFKVQSRLPLSFLHPISHSQVISSSFTCHMPHCYLLFHTMQSPAKSRQGQTSTNMSMEAAVAAVCRRRQCLRSAADHSPEESQKPCQLGGRIFWTDSVARRPRKRFKKCFYYASKMII
jgi:hypothetical protein